MVKKILSEILNIDLVGKRVVFYMPTFRKTIYGQENGIEDEFNILDVYDFDYEFLITF